jgi:hypothetical protein
LPNNGNYIVFVKNGDLEFVSPPNNGNYVVVVRNGILGFVQANSGSLQLFNNSLGWTDTESCE